MTTIDDESMHFKFMCFLSALAIVTWQCSPLHAQNATATAAWIQSLKSNHFWKAIEVKVVAPESSELYLKAFFVQDAFNDESKPD